MPRRWDPQLDVEPAPPPDIAVMAEAEIYDFEPEWMPPGFELVSRADALYWAATTMDRGEAVSRGLSGQTTRSTQESRAFSRSTGNAIDRFLGVLDHRP